jgi:hypothetical protein
MRRIMILLAVVVLAQAIGGFSLTLAQTETRGTTTALRRIPVNAQTVTALPRGKNYVVDLTQRGVVYEFDSKSGQIDFARVRVRTTRGEVTMGSYLETRFPKDSLKGKLAGFKYKTQSFTLGTRPPGTLQTPPPTTSNFDCSDKTCICHTYADCYSLASKVICVDWLCVYINGQLVCACSKV